MVRVDGFPRKFGAYLLLSSLGRGGMGEVFLAKKRALGDVDRLCIVKTLRGDLAEHGEYVRRFADEARIVMHLNHTNVCQVYESGKVGEDYFLAMEFIPGVNLKDFGADLLAAGETVPAGLVLYIGEQVCDALAYAHRLRSPLTGEHLRVIHRDVSPANVMVSFEGDVKLIDFGLAESALKTEQTETKLVMGKVAYMSPEQARGDDIDGSADQFAAAIVLYEILSGDRFYGEMNTHQVWQVVGFGGFRPRKWGEIDPGIRDILDKALAAKAADRFPTCDHLRAALEEARGQRFPKANRHALRQLMRKLYTQRFDEQRKLLATFSEMRAPEVRSLDEPDTLEEMRRANASNASNPSNPSDASDEKADEAHDAEDDEAAAAAAAAEDLPTAEGLRRPGRSSVSLAAPRAAMTTQVPLRLGASPGTTDTGLTGSGPATIVDAAPPRALREEQKKPAMNVPVVGLVGVPVDEPRAGAGRLIIGLVVVAALVAVGLLWSRRSKPEEVPDVAPVVTPGLRDTPQPPPFSPVPEPVYQPEDPNAGKGGKPPATLY